MCSLGEANKVRHTCRRCQEDWPQTLQVLAERLLGNPDHAPYDFAVDTLFGVDHMTASRVSSAALGPSYPNVSRFSPDLIKLRHSQKLNRPGSSGDGVN